MADLSVIKLPNGSSYNLKDSQALASAIFSGHELTLTKRGTGTQVVDLGEFDTINITDANVGNLVVTGAGRFTNGLYGNLTGNATTATSADSATTATKFTSAQSIALTGDVTGSASSQAGWSITTTLKNSGVTADSYGPSANASPAHGGTFSVPYITVDAKGRITSASTKTITLPASGNTDTKVTQTAVTASSYTNWRPLVFGASNSSTEGFSPSTVTDGTYTTNVFSVQPSTGTIRATTFKGNLSGTATYSNYPNLVSINEIRFNNKPSDATDIHIGYKWADGTSDAKINSYKFENGNCALTNVYANTFYGALSGNATTATKATQDESGNNIKSNYAASISISGRTITLKNKNGVQLGDTIDIPSDNTNTWRPIKLDGTEILGTATSTNALNLKAGTNISITNSSGTVTIATAITNNVTGSGTSGYLAKFNGTNTITSGPQLASTTANKFLRDDGSWQPSVAAGTGISVSGTTVNHSNSVTAGTAGTSSATSGPTIAVPYVTYDAQGHITAVGTHTHTVNGALSVTSLNASSYVGVNSGNSGTAGGLALYGTAPTDYGIAMRNVSNGGAHGYVSGDWATYFYMKGTSAANSLTRGWIFRNATNGNIGSISGAGNAVFNGSVTIGGNTGNTSGCRMEFDATLNCVNWIFN